MTDLVQVAKQVAAQVRADLSRKTVNEGFCSWCGGPIPEGVPRDRMYCKKSCRQRAHEKRKRDRG